MSIVRKTKSVLEIISIFEQRSDAISVVDLVDGLQSKMNKTTVYRILNRLENEGKIHSFKGSNGLKWYAKCNTCTQQHHDDTHPHFECITCGKVECLQVHVSIPEIKDRIVASTSILLRGQCSDCMAQLV